MSSIDEVQASVESVLDMLVEPVTESQKPGEYVEATQSWSHDVPAAMSPQKFHQEM